MANSNPNKENLKPFGLLTEKEQRKISQKGGRISAKRRAERKTLKEELLLLLSTGNTQNKISIALIEQAQRGNTKAYEIIRDTIGEKPKENIDVSGQINNPFTGMTTEELRKIVNSE